MGWSGLSAWAAEEVSVRLRETSRFVGQPFNFYLQVSGVAKPPVPRLEASPSFEIRLAGSAPATENGQNLTVFTYEATPLKSGDLSLPPGVIELPDRRLEIPATPLKIQEPAVTEEMRLEVRFSKEQAYVGEPIGVTVTWTSTLSFNGIKAVHFRLPIFGSPHFKVYPPVPDIDPKAKGAIGLPVSEERVIAQFSETELNGKSAVQIVFHRTVVPQKATEANLLLPPATLLCSYAEPRDPRFKGARYPSYFNNEFFDEDFSGAYQRFLLRSAPLTLRILPLPEAGRPADFTGIVGAFRVTAEASPQTIGVGQPVTLTLRAADYPFPSLLDLPPLLAKETLSRQFALPERPGLPVLEAGTALWSLPIRPLHDQVEAVPALEFSYFDPDSASYGQTRTEPIPLDVNPVDAIAVTEAKFADGTRLLGEVVPEPGGIFHNVTGPELLESTKPGGWTWPWYRWWALFGLPPALWLAAWWFSRGWRLQRRDPELARRELAFQRLCRTLRKLPEPLEPHRASVALRQYFVDRFNLSVDSGGSAAIRDLARARGVDPEALEALEEWLGSAECAAFAPDAAVTADVGRRSLTGIVRQFERRSSKLWVKTLLLALGLSPAAGETKWEEAAALFQRGNEMAAIDPAQAEQFYRLAASRYEALLRTGEGNAGLLHYNLGNTWFLAGDTGRAVLHYRRAEPWLRGDYRWQQALAHVRSERVDSFPLSVVTPGWRRAFFWHYGWSDQARLQVVGGCLAFAWLLAGVRLFARFQWLPKAWGALGIGTLLMVASSQLHAQALSRDDAVILAREVIARKGDAPIYASAFSVPLHAGAEVTILERRRDWLRVRVEDGNEGWIPAGTAESIRLVGKGR